jgi:LysR family transcriptional regulator, nitrogen assimilation regulatory protein
MNLQQLKNFILIAELGSLSRVSDRIRVAQPALSRQMKLLQEEVGVPLLTRHRHGLRLTEGGSELLSRLSGVLRQLDEAFEDVRTLSRTVRGRVSFGIVPTASYVLAGRLASDVAAKFPGISLRIVEAYSAPLIEWLQRGEIDVAIMYGSDAPLHLKAEALLSDRLVLVGPRSSDLKPDLPVTMAALSRLSLVLPSRPNGLRLLVERAAIKAKVKLAVRFEADSFRLLTDLVERELGFTLLPLSAISHERDTQRLKFAPIVMPSITRQLVLGMPADRVTSRASKTVIALTHHVIEELVRSGTWPAKLLFRTGRSNIAIGPLSAATHARGRRRG